MSPTPGLGGSLNRMTPSNTRSRSRRSASASPAVDASFGASSRERDRHETVAVGRRGVDELAQAPVLRGTDPPGGRVLADERRSLGDRLGRALRDEEWRAVRPVPEDDAEHPALEVVGQLAELAPRREVGRRGRPGDDRPVERIGEARLEVAVEERQRQGVGGLRRVVPVDADGPDEGQLALGQRARLVRAQDRDAAQVLDRRQPLDEHAVGGQRPRAAGEVEGHDRGQQLGGQPDGQRDGEQERIEQRPVERHVDREDRHDEDEGHPGDEQPERPHARAGSRSRGRARRAGGRSRRSSSGRRSR